MLESDLGALTRAVGELGGPAEDEQARVIAEERLRVGPRWPIDPGCEHPAEKIILHGLELDRRRRWACRGCGRAQVEAEIGAGFAAVRVPATYAPAPVVALDADGLYVCSGRTPMPRPADPREAADLHAWAEGRWAHPDAEQGALCPHCGVSSPQRVVAPEFGGREANQAPNQALLRALADCSAGDVDFAIVILGRDGGRDLALRWSTASLPEVAWAARALQAKVDREADRAAGGSTVYEDDEPG